MSTPANTPSTPVRSNNYTPAGSPAAHTPATPKIADTTLAGRPNEDATPEAMRHSEGPVARAIEDQTARLPSDLFLWAGLGTLGLSVALKALARKEDSLFVGQFTAPLLLMGVYDKLVKIHGSDRVHES